MRFLSALLSAILFCSIAALGVVVLVLTDTPALERSTELSPEHVERARKLFQRQDPDSEPANSAATTLHLSEQDLDLVFNYLASRFGNGSASVRVEPKGLAIKASIALPPNPFGNFVNLDGYVREQYGSPVLQEVRVGQIPLPDGLTAWLWAQAQTALSRREGYRVIADSVKSVALSGTGASVDYALTADLQQHLRNAALSAEDRARIKVYQARLTEMSRSGGAARAVSLTEILVPLMRLAAARSVEGGAHLENRALLAALAWQMGGKDIANLIPDAQPSTGSAFKHITLAGRSDLAQHFVVSAALASFGGGPLADAIGVHKEVDDARDGSGFSFKDFAANRAGVAFGRKASDADGGATSLQQSVMAGIVEADLLPAVADLPESMSYADFVRRYGGVGSSDYARIVQEIDRRVGTLSLYR